MTLQEAIESGQFTAKIQRKDGMWRIALYRQRRMTTIYEARELRQACAIALGSTVPGDTVIA